MIPAWLTPIRDRDANITRSCNRWGTRRRVQRFFAAVSRLGDGVFWYVLMVAVAVAGHPLAALHMGLTGLVALLLYRYLKRWTRRPRPCAGCRGVVALTAPLDEFSFPSGHTLHAVSFSMVAIAYFPDLAWLLVPFALLVGLSRVVLGLHYPSDVLAASLIGAALAIASLGVAPMLATAIS
ncbi:MAG TPA: phosphatase PAP2 family protein [Xanthomonadaceae bacterium]|nr:phosphatase PAP2 family protein [Xanthomonadaceae bacterium]